MLKLFLGLSLFLFLQWTQLGHAAPPPTVPDAGQTLRDLQSVSPLKEELPRAAPLPALGEPRQPEVKEARSMPLIAVKEIRITGNTVFDEPTLQALLVDLIGGEHSFETLDMAAHRITLAYHQRGYTLAYAYLPEQAMHDGVLLINVLEGKLSKIVLTNESRLSDEKVYAFFSQVMNDATVSSSNLNRALLLLQESYGVGEMKSGLSAGALPGTSDLAINLAPMPMTSGRVELDNYGGYYTGTGRLGAVLNLRSPFKLGDLFHVNAVVTGESLLYGSLNYQLPVGTSGWQLGFSAGKTDYELGRDAASLGAKGTATNVSVFSRYPLVLTPEGRLVSSFTLDTKKLHDGNDTTQTNIDRRIFSATFSLSGYLRDTFGGGGSSNADLSLIRVRVSLDEVTSFIDAQSARTQGHYTRLTYTLGRLQSLSELDSMMFSLSGQIANKNLSSSEKFSLGGVSGVRAFPQGEASGDQGWLANLEWRHRFMPELEGVMFYDIGAVRFDREPFTFDENRRLLSGLGMGFNLQVKGFQVKTYVAWKKNGGVAVSEPESRDRTPRWWLYLSRSF